MRSVRPHHVVKRLLGFFFLGLYVLIALLNSSFVQSYLGAAAGAYFSREWGGKVRIGALHFSPISHIILEDIELISPTNDTIFDGERITCRFRRFPFHGTGLRFDKVTVRNSMYHFEAIQYPSGEPGTNLDFIINYFGTDESVAPDTTAPPFVVEVRELVIDGVDYRQDLPDTPTVQQLSGTPLLSSLNAERPVSIPHMRWNNVHGRIKDIRVENDDIHCRIMSFSTLEASGLHVRNLAMTVHVSPYEILVSNMDLETDDSHLFCDVWLKYDGWDAMEDYCHTVYHDFVLKPGTVADLHEASWWAPPLWGLRCRVAPRGHFYGTIDDMRVENFEAVIGDASRLSIDGTIKGLPDIENTQMDFSLRQLYLSYGDIESLRFPQGMELGKPLLKTLKQMAYIDLQGRVEGGLSDCSTRLNLSSNVGDLQANVAVQFDSTQQDWLYVGRVESQALGVRSIVPNEWVSSTGVRLLFEGQGFNPEKMTATLNGVLADTRVKGHDLSRTTIMASLDGQALQVNACIEDSLIGADLSLKSRLNDAHHELSLALKNTHLTELGLVSNGDSSLVVSTQAKVSLEGVDIETLSGQLQVNGTHLLIGTRELSFDKLEASMDETEGKKSVSLDCDWMRLDLQGYFDYGELSLMVRDFCKRYMPTYYYHSMWPGSDGQQAGDGGDSLDISCLVDNNFNIDIVWTDPNGSFAQVAPNINIARGTSLRGSYNYTESLKLVLRSDGISMGGVALRDIGVITNTVGENYRIQFKTADVAVGDIPFVHNVALTADAAQRTSTVNLRWAEVNDNPDIESDVELFLTSSLAGNKVMLSKPGFYVMGRPWSIVCPEGILFDNNRLEAKVVRVYGFDQSLVMNVLLDQSDSSFVNMRFDDFSLGRVCDLLLASQNMHVEGKLDGLVSLHSLFLRPYVEAELAVDNLVVNGQSAGKVDIASNWDAQESRLYVDLLSEKYIDDRITRPIEVHGSMLVDGSNHMDFLVELHRLSLQTVGPMLAKVTSNINGFISGNLLLHGTPKDLMLNGTASVTDGLLQVDATGVTYYFEDTLQIANDTLKLHDFALHDTRGNTALVNGNIVYENPELLLDLSLATDAITVLDSDPSGDSFYGRLLVSAMGNLGGKASNPVISVSATSLPGSELHVPVSNKAHAAESDFIHFVSYQPQSNNTKQRVKKQSNSKINIQLDLQVTPGLKLVLPMDFSGIGANVTAVGNGDVRLTLIDNNPPDIVGNYEFSSGSFLLSLLGVLDKNFTIEKGSSLNFPGRVENTRFDISAVYEQRVNLSSLFSSAGSGLQGSSDAYTQVQNVIALSGTLQNPTVKFDIRLPNADPSVLEQLNSFIDLANDQDMLNQTVSLLLMGQFASTGIASEGEGQQNYSSGGWNMLSSTVSSVLSNMIGVVDVNLKYQPGQTQSTAQFDVGISKQWDKLYFESTFGYGTRSTLEADLRNVLVGDMLVGYKFTPNFSFFATHRTNTSYYTRSEIPYKQGVGLKWSKDFNNLAELFRRTK